MNNETKEAFPSLSTLHNLTKLSINTIRDCIDRLVESGFIEVLVPLCWKIRSLGEKNSFRHMGTLPWLAWSGKSKAASGETQWFHSGEIPAGLQFPSNWVESASDQGTFREFRLFQRRLFYHG